MECYNNICCICYNKPKINDIVVITQCSHYICMTCFCDGGYKLLQCPLCRNALTEAYGYKYGTNEKIFTTNNENCPCCVAKKYREKYTN